MEIGHGENKPSQPGNKKSSLSFPNLKSYLVFTSVSYLSLISIFFVLKIIVQINQNRDIQYDKNIVSQNEQNT